MATSSEAIDPNALKARVVAALESGSSVWTAFFWALAESGLTVNFPGMSLRPSDEQITGWLGQTPGFPARKIDYRLRHIADYVKRGAGDQGAVDGITGDFCGYVDDALRAQQK